MTTLSVTLMVAAGSALINLWLSIRIGRLRHSEKVSIGDGGSEPLIRRMRAQANFVENAPFVIALILAIELTQGSSLWLWIAGAAFLVGRVLHGLGMDGGTLKVGRAIGTAVTMLLLLALSVWALVLLYQGGATRHAGPQTEATPPSA